MTYSVLTLNQYMYVSSGYMLMKMSGNMTPYENLNKNNVQDIMCPLDSFPSF